EVGHVDGGALGGQAVRDGAAHAGSTADNGGDTSFKTAHYRVPSQWSRVVIVRVALPVRRDVAIPHTVLLLIIIMVFCDVGQGSRSRRTHAASRRDGRGISGSACRGGGPGSRAAPR